MFFFYVAKYPYLYQKHFERRRSIETIVYLVFTIEYCFEFSIIRNSNKRIVATDREICMTPHTILIYTWRICMA